MLPYFKSELLSQIPHVTHGFFTRKGGVSTGHYASLSVSSHDNKDHVAENKHRIQTELGGDSLRFNQQVHSTIAHHVTKKGLTEVGDILITQTPGLLIGVNTADCMPILFAHPLKPIVVAVHAGWKGLLKGVIQETLQQLNSMCDISSLYCAIGPCIDTDHLEMGEEVYNMADETGRNFFTPSTTPHKWFLDMRGYAEQILQEHDVTHIDHIREDTYSQPDIFFSYRRTTHRKESAFGVQASVIGISNLG